MFALTYRYTRPLVRRLYLRELWRSQGGWVLSVPLVLAAAAWLSLDPEYRWLGGFFAGVSLTYIAVLYTSYRQTQRYRLEKDVNVTITDAGLHFEFASVVSDVPWGAITSVRETGDGLVLITRIENRLSLIPSHVLSPEVAAFVRSKVNEVRRRASDGA